MIMMDRSNSSHRPSSSTGHYSTHHHHNQPHHGSPHLHHLDRPSVHSTPSPTYQHAVLPHLATQQPSSSAARSTPTSYPSPASYPSPSMPAYQYSPQQRAQSSSQSSPYSQPATINLPPIRLNPPNSQLPPPAQHPGSPLLGSPLPSHASLHGYYTHGLPQPVVSHSHITSSPIHQPLRYPLPSVGNPERIMSGGRHKKEIKRRTKTGCLTCRKRRIKCDEGHPTCKNCLKSKRDCMGYDPIFKSQPGGPTAIQPAPSGVSSMGSHYSQTLSTTASSPASSCDGYEYPQIDPALEGGTSHPHITSSLTDTHSSYRPNLKRTFDRTSPFSSASDSNASRAAYSAIPRSSTPSLHRQYDNVNHAKRIKIDDLLSVGSVPIAPGTPLSPPASEPAINISTSNSIESMKNIYKSRYAPAVDGFLEVEWFGTYGARKVWSDSHLSEILAEVFERLKARGGSFFEEEDPAIRKNGKDSDLLWAAVKLCYGTRIPVSDNRRDEHALNEQSHDGHGNEEYSMAAQRIKLVEELLGAAPEAGPLSPRPSTSDSHRSSLYGNQFWDLLGQIVRLRAAPRVDFDNKISMLLRKCAEHVDGKDNRRLLLAVAELPFLHGEGSKRRREAVQNYICNTAMDRSLPNTRLDRRIAGRAMGMWTQPFTDASFCMPPV